MLIFTNFTCRREQTATGRSWNDSYRNHWQDQRRFVHTSLPYCSKAIKAILPYFLDLTLDPRQTKGANWKKVPALEKASYSINPLNCWRLLLKLLWSLSSRQNTVPDCCPDTQMIFTELFYFEVVDIEPEMYEGDIVMPSNPDQSPEVLQKRNAQRYRQYLWTSKIVPYEVSEILGKISLIISIG